MSHDQKPAKVRLVGNAAETRRRDDVALAPGATAQAALPHEGAAPARRSLLLPLLFVLGCALGGAAFPFLGLI